MSAARKGAVEEKASCNAVCTVVSLMPPGPSEHDAMYRKKLCTQMLGVKQSCHAQPVSQSSASISINTPMHAPAGFIREYTMNTVLIYNLAAEMPCSDVLHAHTQGRRLQPVSNRPAVYTVQLPLMFDLTVHTGGL